MDVTCTYVRMSTHVLYVHELVVFEEFALLRGHLCLC